MNLSLKGKQAMVCGSSKGIGKAIATELANMGAQVTLVARNEALLQQGVQDLDASAGQQHDYFVADFSQPEALAKSLHAFIEGKQYHILINNTGGPAPGPIAAAETMAFQAAFNQHLMCNHILAQALVPQMKAGGYGRIVNVISTSVKIPLKGLGVSNTIRGAVANWSKTLATELAPEGITVNNVLPGATATERLSGIISNKAKKGAISEAEAADHMKSEVPMGRFAEPQEVAAAAAFLCSPSAAYITGINIPVDGGRTGCL